MLERALRFSTSCNSLETGIKRTSFTSNVNNIVSNQVKQLQQRLNCCFRRCSYKIWWDGDGSLLDIWAVYFLIFVGSKKEQHHSLSLSPTEVCLVEGSLVASCAFWLGCNATVVIGQFHHSSLCA